MDKSNPFLSSLHKRKENSLSFMKFVNSFAGKAFYFDDHLKVCLNISQDRPWHGVKEES